MILDIQAVLVPEYVVYKKAHIVIKTPDGVECIHMFPVQDKNPSLGCVHYIAMCKIFNTWHAVSKPIYIDEATTLSIYYSVPSFNSLLLLEMIYVDNSVGFCGAELLMPRASNTAPTNCVSVLAMRTSDVSYQKLLRIPYIDDCIKTLLVAPQYTPLPNSVISETYDDVRCVCSQQDHEWDEQFERSMQEHIRQCHVYEDCYECRHGQSTASV